MHQEKDHRKEAVVLVAFNISSRIASPSTHQQGFYPPLRLHRWALLGLHTKTVCIQTPRIHSFVVEPARYLQSSTNAIAQYESSVGLASQKGTSAMDIVVDGL